MTALSGTNKRPKISSIFLHCQIHANVLSETDGGCSSREKYSCSRINTMKLLCGLATSVSAAELHGSGAGSGVGGLVSALTASSTTVGSAVTLALLALASTNKEQPGF